MRKLTVVYEIPEDAPDWFFRCADDGDWNGMLEYVEGRTAASVKLA